MNKTLEEIENDYWGEPPEDSSFLIKKMYELRKKKINHFDIEDLRIMISQNKALDILIPIAFEKLKDNFFAEGDYYEGDLLKSVLTSSKEFWINNQKLKTQIVDLYENSINDIYAVELTEKIRKNIFKAFEDFKSGRDNVPEW